MIFKIWPVVPIAQVDVTLAVSSSLNFTKSPTWNKVAFVTWIVLVVIDAVCVKLVSVDVWEPWIWIALLEPPKSNFKKVASADSPLNITFAFKIIVWLKR